MPLTHFIAEDRYVRLKCERCGATDPLLFTYMEHPELTPLCEPCARHQDALREAPPSPLHRGLELENVLDNLSAGMDARSRIPA